MEEDGDWKQRNKKMFVLSCVDEILTKKGKEKGKEKGKRKEGKNGERERERERRERHKQHKSTKQIKNPFKPISVDNGPHDVAPSHWLPPPSQNKR